jgi:DNA-binding NarL/FixJ family response regulator
VERRAAEALSPEEESVLRALAAGQSTVWIAAAIRASTDPVEAQRARIHEKLGLKCRAAMARYAQQQGWHRQD